MINYKLLKDCPVFKSIPENEIKNLISQIHYQVKAFRKNEIIALTGDTVHNLYIVLSGVVKGEMIDFSGKTIKIEDVEAPRPLAAAFLFGKENTFPVTVTAVNSVELLSIPVGEFLLLLQKNTQILKNYLFSISSRSQFLSRKLHFLSFKTIKGKMAHYLFQQAGSTLHSVELKTTQQQLAELFGVTRPSLARVIGEMQDEKLIAVEKKTVKILNKEELEKIIRHG
jgi:CRP/FNR family transcriptional regulator, dissimilatory nitrate respiration regulator